MAENFTGVLTQCRLETRAPFRRNYYSPAEHTEIYLSCCLETSDGNRVFFKSPAVTQAVASCPGAAIVHFSHSTDSPAWFEEQGKNSIATPGLPNDNRVVPKVKEGDTITIRATVKERKVSKIGKPYVTVNRVSRVTSV